jgi:cysteine desulfuration protein SufE
MNLAEKKLQLTAELAALKSGQDRLALLVERARKQPPLASEGRTAEHLVPGCLAKLWFIPNYEDGLCYFACDSDSLVVKAIAGLLCEFYSGHAPAEILAHDPQFLAPLGITQHLTPNRRNALAKVWDRIREFAQNTAEKQGSRDG